MVLDATLLSTQHYKVRIKGKVEQSRERSSALPYTSVLQQLKREPSGHPRLRSPTFYFTCSCNCSLGVLQGDTLAPYLFIICLDYVLRTFIDKIKENTFKLTKERSRRYPIKTITKADYADDIALLANAPAQAKTLLHILE